MAEAIQDEHSNECPLAGDCRQRHYVRLYYDLYPLCMPKSRSRLERERVLRPEYRGILDCDYQLCGCDCCSSDADSRMKKGRGRAVRALSD